MPPRRGTRHERRLAGRSRAGALPASATGADVRGALANCRVCYKWAERGQSVRLIPNTLSFSQSAGEMEGVTSRCSAGQIADTSRQGALTSEGAPCFASDDIQPRRVHRAQCGAVPGVAEATCQPQQPRPTCAACAQGGLFLARPTPLHVLHDLKMPAVLKGNVPRRGKFRGGQHAAIDAHREENR